MKMLKRIFVVVMLICILLLSEVEVFADTDLKSSTLPSSFAGLSGPEAQELAGKTLASYARNFWNNHRYEINGEWHWTFEGYPYEDSTEKHRDDALHGIRMSDGIFRMDCTGWVQFAVYNSLHIVDEVAFNSRRHYCLLCSSSSVWRYF